MPDYILSGKADQDLTEIYIFSHEQFGEARANAYLLSLEERFEVLARQPSLGRRIDQIRKGYFRYEHDSHSIFYKRRRNGILIMRVLHQQMDAVWHL